MLDARQKVLGEGCPCIDVAGKIEAWYNRIGIPCNGILKEHKVLRWAILKKLALNGLIILQKRSNSVQIYRKVVLRRCQVAAFAKIDGWLSSELYDDRISIDRLIKAWNEPCELPARVFEISKRHSKGSHSVGLVHARIKDYVCRVREEVAQATSIAHSAENPPRNRHCCAQFFHICVAQVLTSHDLECVLIISSEW